MKPNELCFQNETCYEKMTQQKFEHKRNVLSKTLMNNCEKKI